MLDDFNRRFPLVRKEPFLVYDGELREEPGARYSQFSKLPSRLDLIVVKLGTEVVVKRNGQETMANLENLQNQFKAIIGQGYKLAVVTSGAKALAGGGTLENGQRLLMELHRKGAPYKVGELLFDTEDIEREEYADMIAKFTLNIIEYGEVPIINASPKSFREFPLDNSTATGYLATALKGRGKTPLVVMLSQFPGIYVKEHYKQQGPGPSVIRLVLNHEGIEKQLLDEKSAKGMGGMQTTVEAAKRLQLHNIETVIANGSAYQRGELVMSHKPLNAILQERYVGTRFMPKGMWHV